MEIIYDGEIRCRYVAGGGLTGIICAAPDSRRKGVIAACLLGWYQANGDEIAWPDHGAGKTTALSSSDKQLLQEIKNHLGNLLHAGLMHTAPPQIQSLRTLVWSAKGESFPQLSAAVLHLAGAAAEYQDRSARVDTQYLLDIISRIWFQCGLLLSANSQQFSALKGQARRTYSSRDIGKLWVLGASQYRTMSGAKGVSLVAWDIDHNTPYRINIGRTVESARSLDTRNIWGITLPWDKGCSVQQLAGQVITLVHAKASGDNRISLSGDTVLSAVEHADRYTCQLQALGITRWPELTASFESAIAELTPRFEPVLIQPDAVYEFTIDEYEQQWSAWARDRQGQLIKLTLPVNDINNDRVKRINHAVTHYGKRIWGIVLEPQFDGVEIKLLPVSLILRDNDAWLCFSPDFEFFHQRKLADMLARWISKIANHCRLDTAGLTHLNMPQIGGLFDRIADFIMGTAELGLDCKMMNHELATEIASGLKTANAEFLVNVFERMCSHLNPERLLEGYYAFSLAYRRLFLERMIYNVK